jgi:hypothetical protein
MFPKLYPTSKVQFRALIFICLFVNPADLLLFCERVHLGDEVV